MMENLKAILEKAPDGATHYTNTTPSMNIYVKLVHLEGYYVHLSGKWEHYPVYGDLKSLDDLRKMLELQAERDALAAQVEAFYTSLMNAENISKSSKEMISGIYICMDKTPQQHLAEVKAQAGRAGYIAACLSWLGLKNPDGVNFPDADQYADSIRQEKK